MPEQLYWRPYKTGLTWQTRFCMISYCFFFPQMKHFIMNFTR